MFRVFGRRAAFVPMLCTVVVFALFLSGCPEHIANMSPNASFDAKPVAGSPPLRVQFTDTSQPGTAPIHSWMWEFGDGAVSMERNPVHLYYNKPGLRRTSYTVSLTVTTAVSPADKETVKDCVVVTEATTVSQLGPGVDVWTIEADGARLDIPEGALDSDIVVGIAVGDGSVPVDVSGGERLVSDVFGIAHDQEDFFVDVANPMSLKITFIDEMVPAADRNSGKLQILATQESGITIPIMGEVSGEQFRASIAGLPHRASYAVVYRPRLVIESIPVDEPVAKATSPTEYYWSTNAWLVCYTPEVLQALTALRVGTIDYQYPYDQRTYSTAENENSLSDLRSAVREVHNASKLAGFKSPALIPSLGHEFTILLNNMNDPPRTDYDSVDEVTFATSLYGSIVIDPVQLIAISKKNPLPIAGEAIGLAADRMQELDFTNAFAEELFRTMFRGYAYPRFTGRSAVDLDVNGSPRMIPYCQGLEDGLAIFVGQLASAYHEWLAWPSGDSALMARSLGPNEYATLAEPLLAPFSSTTAAYSYAAQDFFFHVGLRFPGTVTVAGMSIPKTLVFVADSYEGFLELMGGREASPEVDSFQEALSAEYTACDLALQKTFDTTLADEYWDYARARAYENGEDNVIRPSDETRAAFTFNEDRFSSATMVKYTFTSTNAPQTISFETHRNVLFEIAPMSTRAILLTASGVSGNLTVSVNATEWVQNTEGNSMRVMAYREGDDDDEGVELSAANALVTLSGLGLTNGFSRAVVLFSNVTADYSYSASLTAVLNPGT
jgi:PKD repeat protein